MGPWKSDPLIDFAPWIGLVITGLALEWDGGAVIGGSLHPDINRPK
jgi:hypothetical protein